MGKAKRRKVHERNGDSMTMKERIVMYMDETDSKSAAQTALKYYPRWREICGVETDDEIDWDNPIVHLERFLCSFRVLAKLTSGDPVLIQEVLDMMDDSQRDTYLNYRDENGNSYRDIEKQSVPKETARYVAKKMASTFTKHKNADDS